MSDTSPRVLVDGAGRTIDGRAILSDIRLSVGAGEIFGLLGPSGSGKTTLVRLIAGMDEANGGSVTVLGRRMPDWSNLARIGYMAQSDALYGELTAEENLDFFASLYGLRGGERSRRIAEALELVRLETDRRKQVRHFSGGMKRRLSLAASLLHRPELLLLDEPTVGIDPVIRQSIWAELARLAADGVSIVVTTHVMDEADRCHRLGMIRDGRLIAVGTPDELKCEAGADTIEAAFLVYGGGASS
jgi:ABC-2 type transport system ATP-binding protein